MKLFQFQCEISDDEYNKAKAEYDRRRSLPTNHEDHISNFKGWLRYYNLLDCAPLVQAISICFDKFYEFFGIDPNLHLSLPSIAFKYDKVVYS